VPGIVWWSYGRAGNAELRHGYTLADLDRLAMTATARDRWHQGMDVSERRDLAWSAIAEHLYASEDPPTQRELLEAAWLAVQRQVQSDRSAHGISNTDVYADAWNFYRYWWEQARHTPGPEERIVDRTALWQIWETLAPRFQRVLLALATHDDHEKAAASLGITRATYNGNLSDARREFYRLWHEGEEPSRLWALDRRSTKGTDDHTVMSSIVRRRKRARIRAAGRQA
jgi:hypothetical protein